jgi:hypothetical protein
MADTPPTDQTAPLRHKLGTGIQALRSSGFLYALNAHVLHGRGYEARLDGEELIVVGYGDTPRAWDATPEQVDQAWRVFEQTLLDAKTQNNPGFWGGHSPGFGGRQQGAQA